MSGINIFVGNLPLTATSSDVEELFGQFGTVTSVNLISDRETGRSRGFGFVEMLFGGADAIEELDGRGFYGRYMRVSEARPREPRQNRGGGGGRGSGRR